jgi:hypothetical protein
MEREGENWLNLETEVEEICFVILLGFVMGPTLPRPISLSEMILRKNGVVVVGGGYGADG